MLRAWANGETFVSATMCPQQCVLVCQDLKMQHTTRSQEGFLMHTLTEYILCCRNNLCKISTDRLVLKNRGMQCTCLHRKPLYSNWKNWLQKSDYVKRLERWGKVPCSVVVVLVVVFGRYSLGPLREALEGSLQHPCIILYPGFVESKLVLHCAASTCCKSANICSLYLLPSPLGSFEDRISSVVSIMQNFTSKLPSEQQPHHIK